MNACRPIPPTPPRRQQGFTLIEMMIAFFVLAIGLLGMAALMTQSVRGNQSAIYRTHAVLLASELVDRMRANPDGVYRDEDGLETAACVSVTPDSCGNANVMALNDLFEWEDALQALLPGGVGVVCGDDTPFDGSSDADDGCDGGALTVVKIWWDDNRDGELDDLDPRVTLVVR